MGGMFVHRFEIGAIEQLLRSGIFLHAVQQANHFAVILLRFRLAGGVPFRHSEQIMGASAQWLHTKLVGAKQGAFQLVAGSSQIMPLNHCFSHED